MVSIRRHENGPAATGSAWLVLALSIASATARLEEEIPGVVVYREGSVGYKPISGGKGSWGDEDLNVFAKTLSDNKTAWGSVPFDYPDLSYNWQEVRDTPGWSWDITLQGDVEVMAKLKNGSNAMLYNPEGVVSLQAPTGKNGSALPVDEEWNMCLLHWDLGNKRYNDQLRTDDGTCSSALSEQCRDALLLRVERAFAADGTCAPVFGFAAGGFYDAGDRAVYNDLGSVAWPVLSVLTGTGGPQSTGAGVAYTRSQLACVRATRAAPGWEVPALAAAAQNNNNTTAEADRPAQTNAASAPDVGAFGAFLLGLGCLAAAFVM